jgi:hypothetical protein
MQRVFRSFTFRAIVLTLLLAYLSFADSSTHDEPAHLASGIYDLQIGGRDLYYVNPPLTRMLAALPASFFFDGSVFARSVEAGQLTYWGGGAGEMLWRLAGRKAELWLSWGRLLLLPLMALGLWATERLALELYGPRSSTLAGWLYVTCPTLLAAGHSVAADGTCSAIVIASCLAFYHWIKVPSWRRSFLAGGALGAALLTKTLVIFLPALFLGYWIVTSIWQRRFSRQYAWFIYSLQFLVLISIAWTILNAAYGFQGTFKRLDSYGFVSAVLVGDSSSAASQDAVGEGIALRETFGSYAVGNRFADTWAGAIRVPFPLYYVYGIDRQKRDFERQAPTYIRGAWKYGSWDDYVWSFLAKVPTGTLMLMLLASVYGLVRGSCHRNASSVLLWMILLGFFALNLCQTNMTIFFRYLSPGFPILYVLVSSVLQQRATGEGREEKQAISVSIITIVLLILTMLEVAMSFPHVTAFCNVWIGGPWYGQRSYIGTNEYGQNLWRLEKVLNALPSDASVFVCETYHQKLTDIGHGKYQSMPSTATIEQWKARRSNVEMLHPGWYVATQYDINPPGESFGCSFLARFRPASAIAPGLFLFYLSEQDIQLLHDE